MEIINSFLDVFNPSQDGPCFKELTENMFAMKMKLL